MQKDCPHCGGLHFGQRYDDCPYLNQPKKETTLIKPTIGRVVWYHAPGSTSEQQPNPALIAYVWSDTCVNLAVFDSNGVASNQTSVFLYQGDTDRPSSSYAEWMPYQQGQAAKTEALEKEIAAK